MITIDELRREIENIGYFATEELIYSTFNALSMFSEKQINAGQDIFALCLEGPPGAGKTEFAKTYTKLIQKLFDKKNVEYVEYQCDATTGKTELFEDINISAAIRRDAEHVNIPGKLVEAINKVNQGKKVILFIDEYDKAREETDAFLLQFLQSGKINSTQHGDLEIAEEYKGNLHVILCKNDMREELSGPLSRRIRIIRLDYMLPETFYKVAHLNLIEKRKDPVNDGLLNLVSLIYEHAFNSKEIYNRLPSCSEMMIAIEDADRLMKMANAPQHIIYNTIINNMFKSPDDIKTFESDLDRMKNSQDSTLAALVKTMKIVPEETEQKVDLRKLIAENVFEDESQRLIEKTNEMQQLIDSYTSKFKEMESKRQQAIDEEYRKILLQNGKMEATEYPTSTKLFEDESAYVKRGYNIFETIQSDWTSVGNIVFSNLSQHILIDKLVAHASKLGIVVYENGIMLNEEDDYKLCVVSDLLSDGRIKFKFFSSYPIIPLTCLNHIQAFVNMAMQVCESQPKTVKKVTDDFVGFVNALYEFKGLFYNEKDLPEFTQSYPNVYSIDISGSSNDTKVDDLMANAVVSSPKLAQEAWVNVLKDSKGSRVRK